MQLREVRRTSLPAKSATSEAPTTRLVRRTRQTRPWSSSREDPHIGASSGTARGLSVPTAELSSQHPGLRFCVSWDVERVAWVAFLGQAQVVRGRAELGEEAAYLNVSTTPCGVHAPGNDD